MNLFDTVISDSRLTAEELAPYSHLSDHELWQLLQNRFHFSHDELATILQSQSSIDSAQLTELLPCPTMHTQFDLTLLKKNRILPLYTTDSTVGVATDMPFNPFIRSFFDNYQSISTKCVPSMTLDQHWSTPSLDEDLTDTELLSIFFTAIQKQASDIHILRMRDYGQLSFRIHGDIIPYTRLSLEAHAHLIQLIKLHSHMDIGIHTYPQDGHLTINDLPVDIRTSSLPTAYGEDFVLRLLPKSGGYHTLHELGLAPSLLRQLYPILNSKSGLFLVTGATGSGKTTSLYACLDYLFSQKRGMIVTLENPIERHLDGIRQSQINPQNGYFFPQALRATLRQDPDVIMIGEIRDSETAKIALEAAYTGHLVLSTLHTTNVESTLLRLSHFDLDPFLVGFCLKGVLSQQLIKHACPQCKTGCSSCNYSGVTGRKIDAELLSCLSKTATPASSLNPDDFIRSGTFTPFSHTRESEED